MAYLVKLKHHCSWTGCPKAAMYEVKNRVNASMGYYCSNHAKAKLSEAQRYEASGQ